MRLARWSVLASVCALIPAVNAAAQGEFPQANGWSRVTPSVVWCGDPASTTTIEFHVVGRTDVAGIEVTNYFESDRIVLYDDGTHGDVKAADNTFTASGVQLRCPFTLSYGDAVSRWVGFLRVTLKNGTTLENSYGISAGVVSSRFKGVFPVVDLGNGLSATSYALFIDDRARKVIDDYPVAHVFCGTTNVEAYRRLYSVLPDVYDVALVTPGMQILRPDGFGENVPYNVKVTTAASHAGIPSINDASRFGSAGRLKSTIYESFADIQIFDHEIAHTWGANIGESLGLSEFAHWTEFSDIGGQLGAYHFAANGTVGHFAYNGDNTWRFALNSENQRYAPLELYMMGLIPADEVPPIHILTSPDLTNPNRITAASVRTVTIQDIIAAEGGVRSPVPALAQKDFRVAYIVTQDTPYNDAAYAFFSLLSQRIMTKEGPEGFDMYAPFYWATGGRATVNTELFSGVGPNMTVDRASMAFVATTTGASFAAQTPAQTVRLMQGGPGTVAWTATSTAPWLVVSPTSGTGPVILTVSTRFASGLTASQSGHINLAFAGAGNMALPIGVTLSIVPGSATPSPPFGALDTPLGDATVLAGSISITGWALDNIGVQRVELWRDLQPGETTAPFAGSASDPRSGKIFIANATFVEGARPDVEALNATTPFAYRAGWGYLLLTWGLWNQGNGTYKLYAFAFDQENNVGTIGAKTVVISNNAATRPFGSIDTPEIGGNASGPNFGWGLTPKVNGTATCKIPPNGVQVSIDSGPLQPVVYGDARPDIASGFPGFSNTAGAGGHFIFDWSTLTNGAHTIGWLISDDCNRADGIGSRVFNVTNGVSALTSAPGEFRLTAFAETSAVKKAETTELLVSRGYGDLPEMVRPDDAGSRTVEITQGERIEMRLPRGFESASQLVNDGRRRALPIGATWEAASGTFYWQPAPGFLGRYRFVFSNGSQRINVRVVVRP